MKIDVSGPVQEKTRLCGRRFDCLSGTMENICKVTELKLGDALLIACAAKVQCKYNESFGSWAICTCPVRKEIYDRLGV